MILVVGATGQLGGRIVSGLVGHGWMVRALVRSTDAAERLRARGVEPVLGDLKDPESLPRACAGVRVVLTTANSAARGGSDNPETVEEQGNRNLIDAAREAGVDHFVFVSALGAEADSPIPFLRGKARTERYLMDSGLNYTILQPNLFLEIWLPNVIGRPLSAGQPVTLIGAGTRRHSMISMSDVAAFAVAVAGNARAHQRILVLGGPRAVSWLDVIEAEERITGRHIEVRKLPVGAELPGYPDFVSALLNALEQYDTVIPMTALAAEFGVRQVSLEESIREQQGTLSAS